MLKPKELSDIRRPLLIGHRGYPARYPENTLAAFTGAMDAGCDMIELDVTLTRDRRVVVIHDDTLDRTTNGSGPVRDRTVEEMRKLDAGSWFAPRFAAERVPLLDEVIALTAGRCMLNIEIKESAFEEGYPADAIEHQVAELVKTAGAMDRVIVSSFDRRILERLARMPAPPALAFIIGRGRRPRGHGRSADDQGLLLAPAPHRADPRAGGAGARRGHEDLPLDDQHPQRGRRPFAVGGRRAHLQ